MFWMGVTLRHLRQVAGCRCGGATAQLFARMMFCAETSLLRNQHLRPLEFVLDALPPKLREEFDCEENARNLRHLIRRPAAPLVLPALASTSLSSSASDLVSVLRVLPSWAHMVSWRCTTCGSQWAARPVDRLDPQVSSFYACPKCVSGSVSGKKVLSSSASSSSSMSGTRKFAKAFPLLAAQWDECRNAVIYNRVLFESVVDVPLPCSSVVWWSCPQCQGAWQESVDSRVQRYVQQQMQCNGAGREALATPLCTSCESRRSHNPPSSPRSVAHSDGNGSVVVRRFLKDDPQLLAEALLQPHEIPSEIPLRSEKLLRWKCRCCSLEYTASVADRFLRYRRCPQCSGATATPLNLLTIQRPDVVLEVARTVSRSRIRKMTIHDDTIVSFVCRVCLSPYRMPVRLRCLLQKGSTACPKCLWNRSELAKEVVATSKVAANGEGARRSASGTQVHLPLMKNRRKARNCHTFDLTLNELRRWDMDLMN